MKFSINKSILLKALVLTGNGIAQKSVIPILSDYLFKFEGSSVHITGGSEGFFVSTTIDIFGEAFTKAIAIPGSKLLNIVKAIPDQPIEFTITEKQEGKTKSIVLKMKTSTGNYNIPVEEGADYPQMPVTEVVSFDVELKPLVATLNKTLFACSDDSLRPSLTGIFMSFDQKQATFVGCNGHIVSVQVFPVEFEKKESFVVPTRILSVLQQVLTGETVNISFGTNNIHVKDSAGVELKSLLIDEKYVDYEPVIPIKQDKHVIVNVPQLMGAIKRVSLFTELPADTVKIVFSGTNCIVSAKNTFGEDASEELSIQYNGEEIAFGASAKQFTTCLSKLDKEEANILLTSPNRAIVMADDATTIDTKKQLFLMMPFILPD